MSLARSFGGGEQSRSSEPIRTARMSDPPRRLEGANLRPVDELQVHAVDGVVADDWSAALPTSGIAACRHVGMYSPLIRRMLSSSGSRTLLM
jgi:hypothetical protein